MDVMDFYVIPFLDYYDSNDFPPDCYKNIKISFLRKKTLMWMHFIGKEKEKSQKIFLTLNKQEFISILYEYLPSSRCAGSM